MVQHIDSPIHISTGDFIGRPSIAKLLRDEARTKPAIAALIERAPTMTDAEIEAAVVQLPWQRKALYAIRQEAEIAAAQVRAQALVDDMGEVAFHPPQKGVVVRHTGLETSVVPPARGGRPMAIVIKTGDILFVTRDDTWHGSLSLGHPQIKVEIIQTDATREDYFRHYEREAPSMEVRGAPQELGRPASMGGLFQIIR
ncbi:MAG: hypothetical protein DI537_49985 [Stutzerimonas stutzeri]|nr:MAG: hypothetical protein DI537_49985 [Stutzerimonas stutzeri]